MHNLLIYNIFFFRFVLAFFSVNAFCTLFRLCSVFFHFFSMSITFVWRIECDILKFNRCKKKTKMRQWLQCKRIFFLQISSIRIFFCQIIKQVQRIIQENSTFYYYILFLSTLFKQTSYRLHDEHLFSNHFKVCSARDCARKRRREKKNRRHSKLKCNRRNDEQLTCLKMCATRKLLNSLTWMRFFRILWINNKVYSTIRDSAAYGI